MQLNFLQEDLAAVLQKSKKTTTHKNIPKLSSSTDLFSSLPLAMPDEKPADKPVIESRSAETKENTSEAKNPEVKITEEKNIKEKVTASPEAKLSANPIIEMPKKSDAAFKTISEVSAILDVPQHVLRFWESRFAQIKPLKMSGGRRYYRPEDIDVISKIHNLLYKQGYTIKGAKKALHHKEPAIKEKNIAPPVEVTKTTNNELILDDKQKKQITILLKELLTLRETLRPYLPELITA